MLRAGAVNKAGVSTHHPRSARHTATASAAHAQHSLNAQPAAHAHAVPWLGRTGVLSGSCPSAYTGSCLEQQQQQQQQQRQPQLPTHVQLQARQQQQHQHQQQHHHHQQQQQEHALPLVQQQHGQLRQTEQEQAHEKPRKQQLDKQKQLQKRQQPLRQQQQQQQQQRQPTKQLTQGTTTDAAVREALQSCSSWHSLQVYLQQQVCSQPLQQPPNMKQQQHPREHKQLWQQLNSFQSQLVMQHTIRLAADIKQQQQQQPGAHLQADAQNEQTAVWAGPSNALQELLLLLARRAVLRITPGDEVIAAEMLRAVGRLDVYVQPYQEHQQQQHQYQQQQQQQQQGKPGQLGLTRRRRQLQELGQRLLDCMCSSSTSTPPQPAGVEEASTAATPAAAAAASQAHHSKVRNAQLLGYVAKAVLQLQLQPSQHWLLWFEERSTQLLQQAQQQQQQQQQVSRGLPAAVPAAAPLKPQTLEVYLQVAAYCKQQQQQHKAAAATAWPSVTWQQAWAAAACQLSKPFSSTQLLQVASAAQQLQLQLPDSFWQQHLQASAVSAMPAQQLLQLLPLLPEPAGKQQQQQRGLLPADWRAAAVKALPAAACNVAAAAGHRGSSTGAAAAARLLPAAVWAAYRVQLPVTGIAVQQLLEVFVAEQDLHNVAVASTKGSSSSVTSCILQQVSATKASHAVFALAQMSLLQPPPLPLLLQLQASLLPLLPHCSSAGLIDLLWVFAVKWRVQPGKPWLTAFLQASKQRLQSCSAKQLRLIGTGLALLQVQLPSSWQQEYLQATAAVMGLQSSSSSSSVSSLGSSLQQQNQQALEAALQQQTTPTAAVAAQRQLPSAAFLANVAYSLAQLQVVPPAAWQLAWQHSVMSQLQHMNPNQAIDTLCAAAAWAEAAQEQDIAAAPAAQAAQAEDETAGGVAAAGQLQQQEQPVAGRELLHSSTISTISSSSSRWDAGKPALLPKPQLRVAESASAGRQSLQQQQQRRLLLALPEGSWTRSLLHHLRHLLPQCTPTQLTTALRCLRPLRYKASLSWMDALCDALLAQLQQCSMLQLQQLLRGLLHQRHELAPARIDAVLDAALVLQGQGQCSEQQLVWLLQLVVQLHHEPEPEWTEQLAAAAEHMLSCSSSSSSQHAVSAAAAAESSSSSSSSGWSPELLTDLLDSLAQLGPQQLPDSWPGSYRRAVLRCLRQFSGSQLARLVSAAALLHWQVPRPFLQQLLRRLQLHMPTMDGHALGLVGVAVGQMELPVCGSWARAFLRRLQQLARSRGGRIAVSDASNLQRSVQYLRWCGGRACGLKMRRCGRRRFRRRGGVQKSARQARATHRQRQVVATSSIARQTSRAQLSTRMAKR